MASEQVMWRSSATHRTQRKMGMCHSSPSSWPTSRAVPVHHAEKVVFGRFGWGGHKRAFHELPNICGSAGDAFAQLLRACLLHAAIADHGIEFERQLHADRRCVHMGSCAHPCEKVPVQRHQLAFIGLSLLHGQA